MKTIGVIDIGTNSIRLAISRIDTNHNFHTLTVHKEAVRLGEDEFVHNKITLPAMERGLLVLKRFADIARKNDVSELVAVATAAVREAQNRAEFVERARTEAGVDVRVISGLEEARLIYLGVVSGIEMNSSSALFVDIGGGTTELIVGDSHDYAILEGLKFGAIRLADLFLSRDTGVVSRKKYEYIQNYIRGGASNTFRKIREHHFDLAYGSSGTIMNLAEITARRLGGVTSLRNYCLTYPDLCETISILCSLDLERRRNVPGINPERADIIVSGAAILDAVMAGTGADSIRISDRALREGVLVDHLFMVDHAKEEYLATSARQRSVLHLCQSCKFDEGHATRVRALADSMFHQLKELGLHPYDEIEAELLGYAAMVHDIGAFISHSNHHKHSYYLTRNWNLLGFDDREIDIIATTALCHRKQPPSKAARGLSVPTRKMLDVMASVLRVADALDRSQLGLVNAVILRRAPNNTHLTLEVYAKEDCPLEMWALESRKSLFEDVFGMGLSIKK